MVPVTEVAAMVPRQVYVEPPAAELSSYMPRIVGSLVKQGFEPIPELRYGALKLTISAENGATSTRVAIVLFNGIDPLVDAEARNAGVGNAAATGTSLGDIAASAADKFSELLARWRTNVNLQNISETKK
jgi:hypothetical protein